MEETSRGMEKPSNGRKKAKFVRRSQKCLVYGRPHMEHIATTEGRDREQLLIEAAPEEVQVEASAREAEPQTENLLAASGITLVAQSVTVEHTGAQRRKESLV
ncbi:hypothetical protein V6N13_074932 [Hibiscus sabdariffa]